MVNDRIFPLLPNLVEGIDLLDDHKTLIETVIDVSESSWQSKQTFEGYFAKLAPRYLANFIMCAISLASVIYNLVV